MWKYQHAMGTDGYILTYVYDAQFEVREDSRRNAAGNVELANSIVHSSQNFCVSVLIFLIVVTHKRSGELLAHPAVPLFVASWERWKFEWKYGAPSWKFRPKTMQRLHSKVQYSCASTLSRSWTSSPSSLSLSLSPSGERQSYSTNVSPSKLFCNG